MNNSKYCVKYKFGKQTKLNSKIQLRKTFIPTKECCIRLHCQQWGYFSCELFF